MENQLNLSIQRIRLEFNHIPVLPHLPVSFIKMKITDKKPQDQEDPASLSPIRIKEEFESDSDESEEVIDEIPNGTELVKSDVS